MRSPALLDEQLYRIRTLESRLQELCNAGELSADLHFSTGQEAIAVGVMAALRPTDYIVTHHRTIASAVAKGVPLRPLVAELLGKPDGLMGGVGGEMHMAHMPSRFVSSFQLVGTAVSFAAGVAWAVKHHLKTDDIGAVFFGDAATANGQWHEGVNLAAVQGLPLLLVCENNHLAGNVHPEHYRPRPWEQIAYRVGTAYRIENDYVDGNDLGAVLKAGKYAVERVRDSHEPFFLECDTTRLGKHKQGQSDLRGADEMERLRVRDPLRSINVSEERRQAIRQEIEAALRE